MKDKSSNKESSQTSQRGKERDIRPDDKRSGSSGGSRQGGSREGGTSGNR